MMTPGAYIVLALIVLACLITGTLGKLIVLALLAFSTYAVFRSVGVARAYAKLHESGDNLQIEIGKLENVLGVPKEDKKGDKKTGSAPRHKSWGERLIASPDAYQFLKEYAAPSIRLASDHEDLRSQEFMLVEDTAVTQRDSVLCTRTTTTLKAGTPVTQELFQQLAGCDTRELRVARMPTRDYAQRLLFDKQRELLRVQSVSGRDMYAVDQSARLVGWATLLWPWMALCAAIYLIARHMYEARGALGAIDLTTASHQTGQQINTWLDRLNERLNNLRRPQAPAVNGP